MQILRFGRLIAASVVAAAAMASFPVWAETTTLKLASENTPTHPVGVGLDHFAKRVEELSGGEMKVQVYPNGTLGNARETVEGMQIGTIDITTVTVGVLSNFTPAVDFFQLPFIWDDQYHLQRAIEGPLGDLVKEKLIEAGFYPLGFSTSGARQLYTDREINGVEDIEGMKLRTMDSPQIVEAWRLLGAIPTPIAWGEVYQALQTGVVDGAESNFPAWISAKHYEQARNGYRINYMDSGRIYMISAQMAEQLGPERVGILEQAMHEAIHDFILPLYEKEDTAAAETVKKYGAQIVELDIAPFKSAVAPLHEEYKPSLGPQVFDLIEAARTTN